jgi:hypothetical protein
MTASDREPAVPREGQAPVPREQRESAGQRPRAAEAEAEALRRRLAVMRAYLGIIG